MNEDIYGNPKFDDGRGKYPAEVKVRVPKGFMAAVRQVADREGLSAHEYIRNAVEARLAAALNCRRDHSQVA